MSFSRLKIPLPGMELGHVNVYVLKCKEGYGLIDVGLATYEGALALLKGLKEAGIKPDQVARVYITHFHADHITLAQLLAQVASPDFYIGKEELKYVATSFEEIAKLYADEYKRHGAPPEVAEAFLKVHSMSRFRKSFDDVWELPWREVSDGEKLDCGLEAVWTPGHTPGHIVYKTQHGLFTGDHILPRITPNISWYPIPGFTPLGEYLKSLKKTAVRAKGYPAHGDEIPDISARAAELIQHHEKRLQEILQVLKEPMSTYQVAKAIKWDAGQFDQFDVYNKIFAIGEAYSHLLHLELQGKVKRIEGEVVRWAPA